MKYGIHSLVFKQCVIILLGITLVFAVVFGVVRYNAGKNISSILMERGTNVSEKVVSEVNRIFSDVESQGDYALLRLQDVKPGVDGMSEYLKQLLLSSREKIPELVAVAFAADTSIKGEYMRLAHFDGDSVKIINGSNYSGKEWFVHAKKVDGPIWHEPFKGDFVQEPIAIYTLPIYITTGKEKVFAGVLCLDISLGFLQKSISSIHLDDEGYPFMLSAKDMVVAHPKQEWVFKETIQSLRDRGMKNPDLDEALFNSRKFNRSNIVVSNSISGEEVCMFVIPMKIKGWIFGIVWPSEEFFANQRAMGRLLAIVIAVSYLFMLVLILVVSFKVAWPLNRMSRVAHDLGKGDFSVKIPSYRGKDEVAQFSQAFSKMRESLHEYVENLKNMTNQKLRMESELNVARDIQLGVLPKDEEEEGMRDSRHDLSAFLEPARGVGGDFYDFYALDENRIVILIADVSGKGVPAALFMMSVRTQLKSLALSGLPLEQVFSKANDRLAHKNDSNMFVTVWMGILDLRTGHVDFCSAGHNPPAVCHEDGTTEFIKSKAGLVLAGMVGTKYKVQSFDLKPGETLFLYTDGVTEASNEWQAFFGEKRLLTSFATASGIPTDKICNFMKSRIDEFVGGAPQFDDITMLVLKYHGTKTGGNV